jgi:hypothetical protein
MTNGDLDDPLAEERDEAARLGFRLTVREAVNATPPSTHVAEAYPITHAGTAAGKPLAYGTSPKDAAQAGLAVLRAVDDGQPWPTLA